MEQIDGSETSALKNQTPGIHPKDYSQYSKHGENLKSGMFLGITPVSTVSNWSVLFKSTAS
jgi:hypothetical protein